MDRLTTSDEKGRRLYVYPADVRGVFTRWRQIVYFVLILLFLALPWLKISGEPSILLDILHRKFVLFGVTFWAHDAPLLFFIFCGSALLLGLMTAVWGRIWCGWACPQTVFIEGVFRKIERWIEGNERQQRKFHAQPMTLKKFARLGLKWLLFTLCTLVMTHSFLAYFVGTEELSLMIRRLPMESPVGFLFMAGSSAFLLFNFGWFREQFCTIACPYGRFQSILMDDHSITVSYDQKRGEPRKGAATEPEAAGDCINCFRCVVVCPTGIDIRHGTQMECIACTACIDACDEIMDRIRKPRGLIRYASASALAGLAVKHVRARTILYFTLTLLTALGLFLGIAGRHPVTVTFVRSSDSPYQIVDQVEDDDSNIQIVNHLRMDVTNQSSQEMHILLKAAGGHEAREIQYVTAAAPIVLSPGQKSTVDVFVRFEKHILVNGSLRVPVDIVDASHPGNEPYLQEEITLVGPYD